MNANGFFRVDGLFENFNIPRRDVTARMQVPALLYQQTLRVQMTDCRSCYVFARIIIASFAAFEKIIP